ncbi:unnamed protein product [Brachionus calyciflorus]|uniref:Uncharacterized protein n=1 Tax=Brachionus calyciflorus TaxID=104777 RepID=A0A814H0W3_9BILA|nr:unnamed protein product [Brachionus calyciflorus]
MVQIKSNNKNSLHIINVITLIILIALSIFAIVVSVIYFQNSTTESRSLLKYEEVKQALNNGHKLRIVMDYKDMNFYFNDTLTPSPDEKSGFDLNDYQYFARNAIGNPKEFIITSFTIMVVHPRYGPIFDYGKIRMYEDEKFELIVYFLNAADYKVIEYKSFNTTLDAGHVRFYQQTSKFTKFF